MLCSASKSNWLDRLHLSKGFSVPSSDLNLDHFLLSSNPDPSPPMGAPPPAGNAPSAPHPSSVPRRRKKLSPPDDKQRLANLMSNALAELFVMSGPPSARKMKKKSARKQPKPRACLRSFEDEARPATSPPSSAENSVAEAKKKDSVGRGKARKKRAAASGPGELDLSAYSRTEVTVIDSSVPGWKSEKIIFRKGTVWKVRDKKAWKLGKKKRKLGLVGRLAREKEKEQLFREPKVPPPSSSKEPAGALDDVKHL